MTINNLLYREIGRKEYDQSPSSGYTDESWGP